MTTLIAERFEDMSPRGRLRVLQQDDGDMIVCVLTDPNCQNGFQMADVEFCTSGGKSQKTLQALRALMIAMAEDNADNPNCSRRGESGLGVTDATPIPPTPTPATKGGLTACPHGVPHCWSCEICDVPTPSQQEARLIPAKVSGVGRDSENERTLIVYFDKTPSDDDLRKTHDLLCHAPIPPTVTTQKFLDAEH